jgi:outer membrane protein OmpA-like peptidoglycan-associated protein
MGLMRHLVKECILASLVRRFAAVVFGLLVVVPRCFADEDEPRWFDGIFIEGGLHYYFSPDALAELVNTRLGFRAALGYEYRNFSLALETGYSHITGTNPLVLESTFIPLALKAGYNYPLPKGFGVQGDILLGYIFSRTIHYETAIDAFLGDNLRDDNERSPFAGARLYGTWTVPPGFFPQNFLTVYAGGGIDVINETDGIIGLPLVEIGLHIHPLKLIPRPKPKPQPVYEEPEPEPVVYEEPETEEPEIPPEPLRLVWLTLFPPNKTTPQREELAVLDQAAGVIKSAEGEYTVILKGYAAPFVSVSGQNDISRRRVLFCKTYLMKKHGIPEDRITIEWFGSQNIPEGVRERDYEGRRGVEIIFEGVIPVKEQEKGDEHEKRN